MKFFIITTLLFGSSFAGAETIKLHINHWKFSGTTNMPTNSASIELEDWNGLKCGAWSKSIILGNEVVSATLDVCRTELNGIVRYSFSTSVGSGTSYSLNEIFVDDPKKLPRVVNVSMPLNKNGDRSVLVFGAE